MLQKYYSDWYEEQGRVISCGYCWNCPRMCRSYSSAGDRLINFGKPDYYSINGLMLDTFKFLEDDHEKEIFSILARV